VHPSEHLEWLRESVAWYLALDPDALSTPIPRCPGWRVDTVYDHLGRGVGLGRNGAERVPKHTATTRSHERGPRSSKKHFADQNRVDVSGASVAVRA
jgi:hypothetical protein